MHRRMRGFTLVELLVVVGVIAILIAMLLPSLNKARQQAKDVACASNMRQCLMAIQMYNNQYQGKLRNYMPTCPYWGKGYPDGAPTGAHYLLKEGTLDYAHVWFEGRSMNTYWRAYLGESRLARPNVMGCNVTDYSANLPYQTFWGSYNHWSVAAWGPTIDGIYETTDYTGPTFRKTPSYIWYGPGVWDEYNVGVYATGLMIYDPSPNRPLGGDDAYKKRRLLLVCPKVWLTYLATGKGFVLPHRPQMFANVDGGNVNYPYAGNCGFSDGSVAFFVSLRGEPIYTSGVKPNWP